MAAERILAVGEILWDVFEDSARLGGAPLNFAAHARRMGHDAIPLSAVGDDELGRRARAEIEALGLSLRLTCTTPRYPTGAASVQLDSQGHPAFRIHRPAAYDATEVSERDLAWLKAWNPGWLYFGSLMFTCGGALEMLGAIMDRLPGATRLYDVNLRPGSYTPALVADLMARAHVIKLNEEELEPVARFGGLPYSDARAFAEAGAARYGWRTVCVTLGERGCGIWRGGEYVEAPGRSVAVVDTVGAGDAFTAALVHGLARGDKLDAIASFANRLGALIAGRAGAIPEWRMKELED